MRSAKDLRIIAIEGGDFTGKTTQAKLLAEKLDGLNIVIHFPRVNPFCNTIFYIYTISKYFNIASLF